MREWYLMDSWKDGYGAAIALLGQTNLVVARMVKIHIQIVPC
jgi:hypothetical protein